MTSFAPRTALPGRSRSAWDELARGLGYFSIALGVAELLAPRMLCRAAGIEEQQSLVRAYGVREIANGVAILTSHDATPWVWERVAGDAIDIATVTAVPAASAPATGNPKLPALVALAGVAGLDLCCAIGISREKGSRNSARADYRERSGFPKGADQARGAGRNFTAPGDMRTPDALRPTMAATPSQ